MKLSNENGPIFMTILLKCEHIYVFNDKLPINVVIKKKDGLAGDGIFILETVFPVFRLSLEGQCAS